MSDNMIIYNQVRTTPENAKTAISSGKLKGKTDINPMFRIETLTKVFGPIGIGWYYDVLRIENLTIPETQEIACFVDINLFYKWEGEWSKPVFGTGGSMLLENFTHAGLKTNDDGYKMALTDAISVAAKELGVSADVYWAKGETKYNRAQPEPFEKIPVESQKINIPENKTPAKVTVTVQPDELSRRIKEVGELQKKYNISPEKMKVITDDLKVRRLNEMTAGEYEDFLVAFKNAVS
jgi:hypothetical protein